MAIHISRNFLLSVDPVYLNDLNEYNPVIGYDNLVDYSTITADSSADDFPPQNIGNDSTNNSWLSESLSTQYVYFVIAATGFNYFGIAGHNLNGATLQFQSRASTGDAWTNASEAVTPTDNEAIMFLIDTISHAYVRLKIIPASLYPQISVIYIGMSLTLQRRIGVGHTPINYGRNITVQTGFSEDGAFLGRVVKRRVLQSTIKQDNVSPAYYRNKIDPFAIHAQTKPFFFAHCPARYPKEVGFCWAVSDLVPEPHVANGMVKFDLNIRGLAPWI